VQELERQLAEAREEAGRWQQLHGELHAFCMQRVLGGGEGEQAPQQQPQRRQQARPLA
jgi:hypothetical protein